MAGRRDEMIFRRLLWAMEKYEVKNFKKQLVKWLQFSVNTLILEE